MEIIDIIKDCTIANGNIIKLPDVQLDRADYLKVLYAELLHFVLVVLVA